MTLNFPNPTRSFDDTRNAVRFVGHDGIFEVRFFVEAGALPGGSALGGATSEAKSLSAFDRSLASIHDVARKVYSNRRLSFHTLSAADFRKWPSLEILNP